MNHIKLLPSINKSAPQFLFTRAIPIALCFPIIVVAQVNSGSNGSDGALNVPTGIPPVYNLTIDMADHPDGIYQYTSVNIESGGTVSFVPNSNNTPVVWLVQSNCVIDGVVDVSGKSPTNAAAGGSEGGPGGYRGGAGGGSPTAGQGPGGGAAGEIYGSGASYAVMGSNFPIGTNGAGPIYGNQFIVPLIGGSGGGGAEARAGSGGGGALLIATSGQITLSGSVLATGGDLLIYNGGAGSGGAVRLVASRIVGTGTIDARAGWPNSTGVGRVRLDSPDLNFGGTLNAASSQGYQPIIIPALGQGAQLHIASVSGAPVPPYPIISAQQTNPVPVVVHCVNIPTNTPITVIVRPTSGLSVSAVGFNDTGTLTSSTATVLINMPRGSGIIYATAATSN